MIQRTTQHESSVAQAPWLAGFCRGASLWVLVALSVGMGRAAAAARHEPILLRNADRLLAGPLRLHVEAAHCVLSRSSGDADLSRYGTPQAPITLDQGAEIALDVLSGVGILPGCTDQDEAVLRLRVVKHLSDLAGGVVREHSGTIDIRLGATLRVRSRNAGVGTLSVRRLEPWLRRTSLAVFEIDWHPVSAARHAVFIRSSRHLEAELRCDEPTGRVCKGRIEARLPGTADRSGVDAGRKLLARGAYQIPAGESGFARLFLTKRGKNLIQQQVESMSRSSATFGEIDLPVAVAGVNAAPADAQTDLTAVDADGGGSVLLSQATLDPVQYSLYFFNQSTEQLEACLFQSATTPQPQGLFSVFWLGANLFPGGGQVGPPLVWSTYLSFVLGSGDLVPGLRFWVSSRYPLQEGMTTAKIGAYAGAPDFAGQTVGAPDGQLGIVSDPSVPPDFAFAGLAMSGVTTFVSQVNPGQLQPFPLDVVYWLWATPSCQPGLLVPTPFPAGATPVAFPPGVTSLQAVYGADQTWSFIPGAPNAD